MAEPAEHIDELTGLYNRRYLKERIEKQVASFVSGQVPFSVVMVDIDHFKEINDLHGHLIGDAVIRGFAHFLKDMLRTTDTVVRYGGDEFICFMPRTSKLDCESVYRRLIGMLHRHDFDGLKLTLSAGIASFPDDGNSLDAILGSADAALYDAKRSGRDQVSIKGARRAELPVRVFVDRLEAKDAMRGLLYDAGGGVSAIVISGVLGIGKTRLAREVLSSVRGREVAWSDCIPLAENIAYHPIRDMMKYRIERYGLAIFESMPPVYRFEIGKLLPEYMPAEGARADAAGLVTDKYRLYEGVRRLIEFGAREKVIIIDNMQWIDAESIEVLKYLMRCLRDRSITFIFIRRQEETTESLQSFLSYLNREYRTQEFALKSFGPREVNETLKTIIGDDPDPALANYISIESGGVPFYIEEIMRELLRSRHLVVEGDVWRFTKPEKGVVPKTLTEVIVQKCSSLNREAHEVLQIACVIGRFDVGLIKLLTGYNEGHIFGLINDIGRLGIVRYVRDHYEFSEVVTRNAIYEHFLEGPGGVALHRRVGEGIEKTYDGRTADVVEDLAVHFYQSRDEDRGVKYCLAAAARAREKYANSNALRFYSWTVELLGEAATREKRELLVDALLGRGSLLDLTGKYDSAHSDLDMAERHALALSDWKRIMAAKRQRADSLMEVAQFDRAVSILNEGIAMAREHNDQTALIYTLVSLGNADFRSGKYDQALKAYDEARQLAHDIGDRLSEVRATFNIGNIHLDSLRYPEAVANYEEALRVHREMGNRLSEGRALNNLGNVKEELGCYDDAAAYYGQSFEISQEVGSRRDECWNTLNLASVNALLGNYERAVKFSDHAVKVAKDISGPYFEVRARAGAAAVLIDYGYYDDAEEHLVECLKMSPDLGIADRELLVTLSRLYAEKGAIENARRYRSQLHALLRETGTGIDVLVDYAASCLVTGDLDALQEPIIQLREAARGAGSPRLSAEIDWIEGSYYLQKGDLDRAEKLLTAALARFETMKSPLRTGSGYYALAQLALARGDRTMATEKRKKAMDIFTKIGARGWIEKANNLIPA